MSSLDFSDFCDGLQRLIHMLQANSLNHEAKLVLVPVLDVVELEMAKEKNAYL